MLDNREKAVSLVEMSVVVLIIAIISAIITGGANLTKTSEIRGIISSAENFRTALQSFEEKYGSLPGDMVDAHSYWDNGSDTICGTATQCNGNGDFSIDLDELNSSDDREAFRAWQHLTLSNFIEGSYSGVAGINGQADIGINTPKGSRTRTGFSLATYSIGTGVPADIPEGTFIGLGAFLTNNLPRSPALTTKEILSIDRKIDDGLPDSGTVRGRYAMDGLSTWQTLTCLSGTFPNRTYDISREDIECIVYFKTF